MISEEDSAGESPPADLEELIRSPPSRGILQAPNWLNKISKDRAEEFLIDRILDNLSRNIPDSVVQLTVEHHLTVDKISQEPECQEAIKNRKHEFTFELRKKNLPAFNPWVEFVPKIAGLAFEKLRFEYLAQPEIAAKDVKVTIVNNHLTDVSVGSLDVSIEMSVLVNREPVKLGTIHRKLNLYQRLDQLTGLPGSTVHPADEIDLSASSESKTCAVCGASISASPNFCDTCGAKQAR